MFFLDERIDDETEYRGATASNGSYIVDIMNAAGYDFAVPGNHEFDYGMDNFKSLVSNAKYTYISCNFTDLATKQTVLPPYRIADFAGTKIGLVGVATPATITSSTPAYFQDGNGNFIYGFNQDESGAALYSAVQTNVDKARAEGAEYVVLVATLAFPRAPHPGQAQRLLQTQQALMRLSMGIRTAPKPASA